MTYSPEDIQPISPDALLLDPQNPRLAQYGLGDSPSQTDILRTLWKRMAVDELALSIANDTFWTHEPLFAIKEGNDVIVIEGNRRLAAVMLMRNPDLRAKAGAAGIAQPGPEALASTEKLPVIIVESRQAVWKYIGFKHVNGPAKWGSYAKAQYIAFIHNTGQVPLDEIAQQIGDTNRTVQRLYRALMVIDQAEREDKWRREYAFKGQFSFSHLMTGLDYGGFKTFLAVAEKEEETISPVPDANLDHLRELCTWLWGDDREKLPGVIKSQNPDLRHLDSVLMSTAALSELRGSRNLELAYEESKGDETLFADALAEARKSLIKAQGRVSAGFHGERSLIEQAENISDMAADLVDSMYKRRSNIEKRRVKPR